MKPDNASIALVCLLVTTIVAPPSSAQSPNKYGWVYQAFPTGYGWHMPRASPTAMVSQSVGVTEISIRYARPSVNGRTIWGDLVPYDAVWRAGANEATVISFSTEVTVEGLPLAAGEYALFALPGEDSWQFIFSNRPHQWGAFTYTEGEDALRVTVRPRETSSMEQLQYTFPVVSDTSAYVELRWDQLAVGFEVGTATPELAIAAANAGFDWQAAFFTAEYLFKADHKLDEALKWANVAVVLSESSTNLLLKARILARLERYPEALDVARHARASATGRMAELLDERIREWSSIEER